VLQFKYQPGPLEVNEYESEKTWKENIMGKYEGLFGNLRGGNASVRPGIEMGTP
jgi:hypothetical protein